MLKYSDVRFSPELHTYTRPDGKLLSGITGMIDRQINGGKFAKMDAEFLRPYAEYGSKVHGEIEAYFTVGIKPTTPEATAFVQSWEFNRKGCVILATEYTVSDNEHFATNVDFVDADGEEINLYDFKTSSVLDKDSLSWQLSICAELFNIQNGFYPAKLFGVHLRGSVCNVVEIERKPTESVLRLLEAEIEGTQYLDTIKGENSDIVALKTVLDEIAGIKMMADEAEARKNQLLEGLQQVMERDGLKSLDCDSMKITLVAPSQSVTLDTKAMKAEHPEICAKFERTTEKKGFVKITIRN